MQTAVIGLGTMGSGMALNLHQAAMLAACWNRSAARAKHLADEYGLPVVENLPDLCTQAELIITCVSADQDLCAVINHIKPYLRPEQIVLDTSTVQAETARQIGKELAQIGVEFLDGPVSGGKEGAWKGQLVMMLGGKRKIIDHIQPVLDIITRQYAHLGPLGAGQASKAVNQIMAAGINQAVTEAMAFGQAQGLEMEKVVDLLSGGAAGNWFLQHRGKSMLQNQFEPGFKLKLHHKDLKICQAMAAKKDTQLPTLEMTLIDYQKLLDAGFGEEDISTLFRTKKDLFTKKRQN